MQKKTIAIAVMLGLQLAAGAVQAEGHKKGSAIAPVAEHAPASKANPRYVINGGEVYDKKTDLTWQRCSVGQHWTNDVGCVGIVKMFNLVDGQKQGDGGWRLPAIEELTTLFDHKKANVHQQPYIDEDAFPDMDSGQLLLYWSSTPNGTGGDMTSFFFGESPGSHPNIGAVRLVRSGR